MTGKKVTPGYTDYNYYVTVKCKKCKAGPIGFYPHRVIALRPCECGNQDYGDCNRDWPQKLYGGFKLIREDILVLTTPLQRQMIELFKSLGGEG